MSFTRAPGECPQGLLFVLTGEKWAIIRGSFPAENIAVSFAYGR